MEIHTHFHETSYKQLQYCTVYCFRTQTQMLKHNRELYTQFHVTPTWYGDLLRYRHGGAVLVSDSHKVGPWTKGYLCTTADGSGQAAASGRH